MVNNDDTYPVMSSDDINEGYMWNSKSNYLKISHNEEHYNRKSYYIVGIQALEGSF